MKAKKPFRIAFYREDLSLIFTTKVYATSIRGAKTKASNLKPLDYFMFKIAGISSPLEKKIDLLFFPNNQ